MHQHIEQVAERMAAAVFRHLLFLIQPRIRIRRIGRRVGGGLTAGRVRPGSGIGIPCRRSSLRVGVAVCSTGRVGIRKGRIGPGSFGRCRLALGFASQQTVDLLERRNDSRIVLHQLELQAGRLRQKVARRPRIRFVRKLHRDTAASLLLDQRLGQAELVDTLADHFLRLVDGVVDIGAKLGDDRVIAGIRTHIAEVVVVQKGFSLGTGDLVEFLRKDIEHRFVRRSRFLAGSRHHLLERLVHQPLAHTLLKEGGSIHFHREVDAAAQIKAELDAFVARRKPVLVVQGIPAGKGGLPFRGGGVCQQILPFPVDLVIIERRPQGPDGAGQRQCDNNESKTYAHGFCSGKYINPCFSSPLT